MIFVLYVSAVKTLCVRYGNMFRSESADLLGICDKYLYTTSCQHLLHCCLIEYPATLVSWSSIARSFASRRIMYSSRIITNDVSGSEIVLFQTAISAFVWKTEENNKKRLSGRVPKQQFPGKLQKCDQLITQWSRPVADTLDGTEITAARLGLPRPHSRFFV